LTDGRELLMDVDGHGIATWHCAVDQFTIEDEFDRAVIIIGNVYIWFLYSVICYP